MPTLTVQQLRLPSKPWIEQYCVGGTSSSVTPMALNITSELLEIQETEYQAIVRIAQNCKDLGTIGDTVIISVTEGVQFSTNGDIGTAKITYRKTDLVVKVKFCHIWVILVYLSIKTLDCFMDFCFWC
ncbi:hypothetical protein V6N13_104579 [Hibiscus sabdariffa]|uniref:Uncharacterized protein n=2 Tax=Hibiscus sabdariffa TaxID=183260 RepID=A0ABR2DES7_9ROSI